MAEKTNPDLSLARKEEIQTAWHALSAETGADHVATEARLFLDEFGSVLLKGDR